METIKRQDNSIYYFKFPAYFHNVLDFLASRLNKLDSKRKYRMANLKHKKASENTFSQKPFLVGAELSI